MSKMEKANKVADVVGKTFCGLMVLSGFVVAGMIVWFVWAASTGNLPQ